MNEPKTFKENIGKKLKCSKCKKICEVGEQTISVVCENCTQKEYDKWIKEQYKRQTK